MTEKNLDVDEDFLEYCDGLEKQWKEDLFMTMPKTEKDWLEIFPEARSVIPEKIKEWEEVATLARAQVKIALQIVEEKSDKENHSFWREVLKYTFQPVRELAFANRRIKSLRWLLPKRGSDRRAKWQHALTRARDQDLVVIAEHYGLRLRKAGRTYQALCPQHKEHTPSFHIYPPSRFVCFGCDIKGDVISFVQMMDKTTFKEAVYKLQKI